MSGSESGLFRRQPLRSDRCSQEANQLRCLGHRQDRRSLHRLLPVRLRQLRTGPATLLPADQVRWGRFNELAEYNNYLLYNELKAAADAPKDLLQKKYGDYFAACMNTELVDKLGVTPLQPELALIEGLKSNKDLAALNLELFKEHGGGELLGVGVGQDQKDSSKQILNTGQGGLSLPDRDYYLNPADARFGWKIRAQYVEHVMKMFVLLGGYSGEGGQGS